LGLIIISSRFERLAAAKQKRILDAALKEFAQNGFEKASTNKIVENAGISKGSLFNYFHSKKNLYIYLLDYSAGIVAGLFRKIDLDERDVFKRMGDIGLQKLKMQRKFPNVFDFLAAAKLEESPKPKAAVDKKVNSIYDSGLRKLYDNIDYSLFRDDLDTAKALEILNWALFGFGEKYIKQQDIFQDTGTFGETILREWETYAGILKKAFYK